MTLYMRLSPIKSHALAIIRGYINHDMDVLQLNLPFFLTQAELARRADTVQSVIALRKSSGFENAISWLISETRDRGSCYTKN
jgi:hypothetical protein